MALLEFLKKWDHSKCEISLYVLMEQGELAGKLPPNVRILNKRLSYCSLWNWRGRLQMVKTILGAFFRNGNCAKKLYYIGKNAVSMFRQRKFQMDKLLWRIAAEGAERFEETFDLAVAWIEGGSAYYVADHVRAKKKAALIHIDYGNAGYSKELDQNCWEQFARILTVSKEVERGFLKFYPQYKEKTFVFPNIIDRDNILKQAKQPGGFSDDYSGIRLLTVGRLVYQKGYDIAIQAMKRLKECGVEARWYILGEGEKRKSLEKAIAAAGLEKDFLLLGAVENPYPYYSQTDLYIHVTRYEGKSVAIQEAQVLGCAVIASDCTGNREQVVNGEDGILCELKPEVIADKIIFLIKNEEKRAAFRRAAREKEMPEGKEIKLLTELLE